MKQDIHPKYYQATVTCACGATFKTGSTKKKLEVDVCSKCHPFFTGEMKYVDTMGRVEKFEAKRKKAKTTTKKKSKKSQSKKSQRPQSLKDMLKEELQQKKDQEESEK